eukprot:1159306-Pelagomonas_calceolata.AAC.2
MRTWNTGVVVAGKGNGHPVELLLDGVDRLQRGEHAHSLFCWHILFFSFLSRTRVLHNKEHGSFARSMSKMPRDKEAAEQQL